MTNQINDYIKYLFEDCYQEDYNPFYAESWCDNYCYDYTFSEWYFLLRKRLNYNSSKSRTKINNYKHTPTKIIIRTSFY
jgi:hypothetical protein